MKCRQCQTLLRHTFLDLGEAPPSNNYLAPGQDPKQQTVLPLRIRVCDECWLVQTEDYARSDELFTDDYAYFSSTSKSWLEHARVYCQDVTKRLGLDQDSFVIELASNDGYLLQNFVAAGIPCLGIEPTLSTAEAARRIGVPTEQVFFGAEYGAKLAAEGRQADLILGNNVYAHVPDINDFTLGMARALKPQGTITLEFPHLLKMIQHGQFDTVYHEHYSYLSLIAVERIFSSHGLQVTNVEEITTHGGSLRIFGGHADTLRPVDKRVHALRKKEADFNLNSLPPYSEFQARAETTRDKLVEFLNKVKQEGGKIAAYGAAAKGNTLLNFAGVTADLLPFVCDAAVSKQGKRLPGSEIPIYPPEALIDFQPDYVLVLPWNLIDEILAQHSELRARDVRFVTAVPDIKVYE
jgi:SAM-dependent methyltransferase